MSNTTGYLTGKLLLAAPQMRDPRFEKAVVLICAHDENGCMGLMINQVMPEIDFNDLLKQLGIISDIKLDIRKPALEVMNGGPVEMARGFLLHSSDFQHKETVSIDEKVSVTGTVDALKEVVKGKGPERLMFLLGHAGWGAGQLEQELQENAWLVADPSPALIFDTDPGTKWSKAITSIGFSPANLSIHSGSA